MIWGQKNSGRPERSRTSENSRNNQQGLVVSSLKGFGLGRSALGRNKKRVIEAVRREKCGGVYEALRREKCEGGFSSHNTEDREQEWGFFSSKSVRKKRSEHNKGRKKKSNARWRMHGELKTESKKEVARKKKNRTGRGREDGGGAGPCKNAWWSGFKGTCCNLGH
ncbi:hypothetical protein Cgig2_002206 [Carnegiea gigantea]|uniref:Uncharacterized protein n=1 Tax=Carnegiea gigantea TaxID=171969 RepID=A0A9Q1JFG5_9CARY|nr:hypothetical protein Cgig2_002206 [Carnegiea gigantea]